MGQHWLFDSSTLAAVVKAGEVTPADTILEIGPGLGTLTELLLGEAKAVVAVEADSDLAEALARFNLASKKLTVMHQDILRFNLRTLPQKYKIIANIPYYLTSKLLRLLLESHNPPVLMSLLVQKEVAERITASPGRMSVLAFSVQYYARAHLIQIVPKELFDPVPKVDSAIIQIKRFPEPAFAADKSQLFRLVKAGFASRRKQLKNALAAGFQLTTLDCAEILQAARISPSARAQELSIADWQRLYEAVLTNLKI